VKRTADSIVHFADSLPSHIPDPSEKSLGYFQTSAARTDRFLQIESLSPLCGLRIV